MLAYIAKIEQEEWQMLIHGETRGKAKHQFCKDNPAGYYAFEIWNDIRLTRLPEFDNKPFIDCEETRRTFAPVDYDENGDGIFDEFINDCRCKICVGHGE